MYGMGSKRAPGSRSGPSSSLMLQQHLVHHYRHLQNARPVIDSGQVTRQKSVRQRPWRHLQLSGSQCPPSSGSTASLQLIDRILNDKHMPPQYYTGQLMDRSDKSSETLDGLHELHAPLKLEPTDMPPDETSILERIDSYLLAMRAEERRQACRRRFNLASPGRVRPGAPLFISHH
ncbi:uncharacterized protein LOC119107837 [Pollicipes pollicipes]|uniref:uncharacterized protein LOC119107837 n=1 Tax=Pollicipes pollicipes TaxID=41117 RepID=UPI00188526E6|nr:uncharacterized protein LOC119107837 [Pollicipes pollicipes]